MVGCDLTPVRRRRRSTSSARPAAGWTPSRRSTCPPRTAPARGSTQAVALGGGVDVLVNNASAIRFGAIDELSYEDWSFTIRNELDIVFLVTRAAWPHLVARGGGSIVNIGSISGSRGAWFMPQNAHGAAKGGVLALTYQLVIEGGPHGIRVNAVSPAMTETPHTSPMLRGPGRPGERILSRVPLGGGASPRTWRTRSSSSPATRPRTSAGPTSRSTAERRSSDERRVKGGSSCAATRLRGGPGRAGSSTPAGPTGIPAAVLEAADDDDVVAGVRLAAERGWTVSVRSGGHSWAAWSLRDDALLIDLGALRRHRLRRGDRHRLGRPGDAGRARAGAVPRRARPRVPRRALRHGRHRRLPAAGRPGLERAGQGLGVREHRGRRRRHRRTASCVRADADPERRPVLGRARRRPGLPRSWSRASTCRPTGSRP